MPDYKNKEKRQRVTQEKAEQLEITAEQLITWLKSRQDRAGNITMKQPSGSGAQLLTENDKWVLNNFGYIQNYKKHSRRQEKERAVIITEKIILQMRMMLIHIHSPRQVYPEHQQPRRLQFFRTSLSKVRNTNYFSRTFEQSKHEFIRSYNDHSSWNSVAHRCNNHILLLCGNSVSTSSNCILSTFSCCPQMTAKKPHQSVLSYYNRHSSVRLPKLLIFRGLQQYQNHLHTV